MLKVIEKLVAIIEKRFNSSIITVNVNSNNIVDQSVHLPSNIDAKSPDGKEPQ